MGRYVAGEAPAMDRLVETVIRDVGAEIDALGVPQLQGVVLGGGYGRGEGGVWESPDGTQRLSNDLDFYVVTEEGATGADIQAIGERLSPVAVRWTARLGVDVDFCVAKTPWRLRHDQERVMIQELLHGYFDVAGKTGEELFGGIERRPPSAFPWTEAVRLLVNRGVGLLLAQEPPPTLPHAAPQPLNTSTSQQPNDFAVRNVNKCILGAGDARLIARGGYRWKATDRATALGEPLYSAAVGWKFRPRREGVCDWETARLVWLKAVDEVMAAGRCAGALHRSLYQAGRWLVRRRTLGRVRTLGFDAVVRMLLELVEVVRRRGRLSPSLRRDWEIFN